MCGLVSEVASCIVGKGFDAWTVLRLSFCEDATNYWPEIAKYSLTYSRVDQ